jgi:hypothetical protein
MRRGPPLGFGGLYTHFQTAVKLGAIAVIAGIAGIRKPKTLPLMNADDADKNNPNLFLISLISVSQW